MSIVGIVANTAQIADFFGITAAQFNAMRPSFVSASVWNLPDRRFFGHPTGDDFPALMDQAKQARDRNHFTESVRLYKRAARKPGLTPRQQAQVYSGMAYAYLRMNKLDDAKAAATKSATFGDNAGSAAIVLVKVQCAAHEPAEVVALSLDTMRQKLKVESWQRRRLERDEELFLMCGYAGAKPDKSVLD